MGFPKYSHDPDAILDYPFKWAEFLADVNDHIESATVAASVIVDDPAPLTIGVVTVDTVTDVVTAWISGGTLGNLYQVTNHIVSTDGREEDQTITLQCKEH